MSSLIGELWRRVLALFRRPSLERDFGEYYPGSAAVLSKRAAKLLWSEGNPIGRRFKRRVQVVE